MTSIHTLASELANRVPEFARDSSINCATAIEGEIVRWLEQRRAREVPEMFRVELVALHDLLAEGDYRQAARMAIEIARNASVVDFSEAPKPCLCNNVIRK